MKHSFSLRAGALALCGLIFILLANCSLLNPDSEPEDDDEIPSLLAIGVSDALSRTGKSGVWVKGYVIGGDLSQKGMSLKAPFKAASNLVLAPSDTTTCRDSCLAVQIPTGALRESLSLVEHPDLIGTFLFIKGDIVETYFGIRGLKNTTAFAVE